MGGRGSGRNDKKLKKVCKELRAELRNLRRDTQDVVDEQKELTDTVNALYKRQERLAMRWKHWLKKVEEQNGTKRRRG
jgi:ribosome recycling factor